MANEMVPQEAAPQGGGDQMKEAAAGLMQAEQSKIQFAEALVQAGQQEAGQMLTQSAQLAMQALEALGVAAGGQAPAQSGNPDTAGTAAQPVDPRTRG